MTKLKLGPVADDKPVKVTLEFSAQIWKNLESYAALLGMTTEQAAIDPVKLVVPMVERFMATDRAFTKARRTGIQPALPPAAKSG